MHGTIRVGSTALLAAALALAGCHRSAGTGESSARIGDADAPFAALDTPGAAQVPTAPDFVAEVTQSDRFEIAASHVALARSRNAEIRRFATQMIGAHRDTEAALARAAASVRDRRPPTLDEDHARLIADLQAARPEEFDTLFLDQQTTAHRVALALMERYASGGADAKLKAFAAETAPKIQGHLTAARGLGRAGVAPAG